ncbi:MAG: hypothetical protein HC868_12465 [Sphingomonadales bacterium]|nr:hypothetical protein [Sphingomonadales bacterium]
MPCRLHFELNRTAVRLILNAPSDARRILEYRADQWILNLLPWALVLLLAGLVMLAYADRNVATDTAAGIILMTAGVAGTAFVLFRRANPGKPVLVLSPAGLTLRIVSLKEVHIPWHEVQAVDAIDFSVWSPRFPYRVRFRDCTAVLVSKAFYDAHIHVASAFMRGPGWESLFRARDDGRVHIALHHDQLSVPSGELRAAVEARWRAFRERSTESLSTVPSGPRISIPDRTALITSPWSFLKIAVPLAGIVVLGAKRARHLGDGGAAAGPPRTRGAGARAQA